MLLCLFDWSSNFLWLHKRLQLACGHADKMSISRCENAIRNAMIFPFMAISQQCGLPNKVKIKRREKLLYTKLGAIWSFLARKKLSILEREFWLVFLTGEIEQVSIVGMLVLSWVFRRQKAGHFMPICTRTQVFNHISVITFRCALKGAHTFIYLSLILHR